MFRAAGPALQQIGPYELKACTVRQGLSRWRREAKPAAVPANAPLFGDLCRQPADSQGLHCFPRLYAMRAYLPQSEHWPVLDDGYLRR